MRRSIAISAILFLASAAPLLAASGTWTSDSDANWSDVTKWAGGTVADGAGTTADLSTVDFSWYRTIILDANRTVGILKVGDSASTYYYTTLQASGAFKLTLDNGGTSQIIASAHGDRIDVPLLLNDSLDVQNTGNSTMNIRGTVTGNGAAGTKTITNNGAGGGWVVFGGTIANGSGGQVVGFTQNSGTSQTELDGVNTYTGPTTVQAGSVYLTQSLTASALNFSGNGTATFSSGKNITLDVTNSVSAQGILKFEDGNHTVSGNVGSTGNGLNRINVGTGTTAFNGDVKTTVFFFSSNGGYVTVAAGKSITSTGGITVGFNGASSLNFLGSTAVSSDIGTNATKLANITFSGGTASLGGNLYTDPTSQGGTGSTVIDSAILNLTAGRQVSGKLTVKNSGSITGSTLTLLNAGAGSGYDMQSGSASAVLAGTPGLTKSTSGTITLTGPNTYTGTTTLTDGILNLGVAESAGTSGPLGNSVAANPGSIVLGGGTLQYSAANQNDYSGRFSTAASQQYNVDTNGQNVTWNSALTSSGGSLTKSGTGDLVLSSGSNSYTGNTTVSAGRLLVGAWNAIPSGAGKGDVYVNGTGILKLWGISQNINGLNGGGIVDTQTANTLTVGSNDATGSFSGVMQNSGGAGNSLTFIKTGAGTQTLSGTNTYLGTTTVSAGTLALTGLTTNNIANSPTINVAGGAGLDASGLSGGGIVLASGQTLKGAGTLTGNLSVGTGSVLAPGNSPGTLSQIGNATFASGGSYIWEINNATGSAGTNWDLLNVTGGLNITAISGSPFTIDITGLTALNAAGIIPNFNKYLPYTWTIASVTTSITGFVSNKFALNSSAFTNNNDISGLASSGVFGITTSGTNLQLTYTGAVDAPATAYWKDTQGTELWNTNAAGSTNWTTTSGGGVDTGSIPGVITDVHFYATGAGAFATNLGQDFTINSLTMDGGTSNNAVSISGNTLTINGASGITMNSGSGMLTLNSNVVLGGAQTWLNNSSNLFTVAGNVDNGTHLLTVDGTGNTAISGVISNGALTKTGTGILRLSGPNTYNGTTTLSNGTLQIGVNSVGSVGSITSSAVGTGALALNGGKISSDSATARTILNAVTFGGNVALGDATNTGKLTFSAAVDLGGATRILTTASDAEFDGVISNGGLTKNGTGALTLSGNNNYTGATTINAGKLTITSATGLGTTAGGVSVANGAILDLNGTFAVGNEAVTLADGSALSSSAGTNSISGAIGVTGTTTVNVATSLTLAGAITCGLGYPNNLIDKTGAGILILSGNADNYALSATVDAGTLSLEKTTINALADLIVSAGTVKLNGTDDKQLWDGGKVTLNGGILDMNAHNETIGSLVGTAGTVTNNATGTSTLTAGADNLSSTFSGTLQDGGSGKVLALSKTGSGALSLSGTNSYSGGTALNAGSLSFANGSLGSSGVVEFKANSTLQWATGNVQDLSSRIKIDDGVTASLDTQANNVTFANAFQTGVLGTGGFTKAGSGILELAGANVYTGTTRINAGTVQVGNTNAFGSGPVINNATVDLGTTNTAIGNVYTQNSGSTLKLTANSSTDYGKITTPSAAVVNSGSSVYVNVGGFIPNSAVLKIIDTGSAGITLAGAGTSPTVNSSNSKVSFLASVLNNDLVLTANRGSTGYAPIATTSDSKAAATVLDNITNPSSDMTAVLNTLDGLTNAQTAAALSTMVPDISGFNPQVPVTVMEQFVGAQMEHLGGVSQLALGNAVPQTGMSAGDQPSTLSTWYKAFGNYAHQDPRGTSQGYNFSNAGGALGFEKQLSDAFKAGVALGNSQSWVRGKDSASRTDINATQASLYGGLKPIASPWYLNGSLNYSNSRYGGSREIHISSSDNRIAKSDYRGDLYGAALETGYGIKIGKNVLTPLASLSYSHLRVGKYSEADAGALNLNVDTQDYDNLRAGLGASLTSEKKISFGTLMSDIHAKALYDVIADRQNMVASFAGGGTSFVSQGYKPVRSGANLGTAITIATKKNITLSLQYDYEMRQGYYAHTGSLNVAYKF